MPEDLLANALSEAAPPPSRPEDVPEKFWDTAAGTLRVDALLKSYRELERRLSQRFAPPGCRSKRGGGSALPPRPGHSRWAPRLHHHAAP